MSEAVDLEEMVPELEFSKLPRAASCLKKESANNPRCTKHKLE